MSLGVSRRPLRLTALCLLVLLTAGPGAAQSSRSKKQKELEAELCKDRGDDFFRLSSDGDCREVYRCTRGGLKKITCPQSLRFDVIQQTCLLRADVTNCDLKEKPQKVLPLLVTDEPICPEGELACGDRNCIEQSLFCDGEPHCADGSDENACSIGVDPNGAGLCDTAACVLPQCFCSADGTQIPGGLKPEETPQMITITFSGSINVDNIGIFRDLFRDERQNPNGCSAKGTFFVSHKYTNYSAVQELHRKGHEIGVFSITNTADPDYWSSGSYDTWWKEMVGARSIIETYANITDQSVSGMRAPRLRAGGNTQFYMMTDEGFIYDSSITAPALRYPIWPYTLDYRIPHKCLGTSQNCPSQSHPIWEMVINELDLRENTQDERLPGCHLLSSCTSVRESAQFASMLRVNFDRHYNTNRAPFGLHLTAGWLNSRKDFREELVKFIDEMLAKNDVYFVTNQQVLAWMENPTHSNQLRDFPAWKEKCDVKGLPYCSLPNACPLTTRELPKENFYLNTCMECPKNYPWMDDPSGNGFDL